MSAGELLFGFGEVDITPTESVLLVGLGYDRQSTGVHDRLSARSMAVSDGENRAVLCVADLCYFIGEPVAETRRLVQERCGLPPEALILSTNHSHTGPDLAREKAYTAGLADRLTESVQRALDALSPCDATVAKGDASDLQFIRRYRMKDGSVVTNPGILNPDVVEPIGKADPDVLTVVASSDDRAVGGLVNFGLHCDTVGGGEISADWTYYLRLRMREQLGDDLALLTPIACCGDVNHWNVFKEVTSRGFEETERIGNRVAAAALGSLPAAEPVPPGRVCALSKIVRAKTRMPTDAELASAKEIVARPPREDVDFELDRVEAIRRIRAAKIGPSLDIHLRVMTFGSVALVGMPAEYFSELGRSIKSRSRFAHTAVITLADAYTCYVGERHNYDEGGYEMVSSAVAPGTGEAMADAAVDLLDEAWKINVTQG